MVKEASKQIASKNDTANIKDITKEQTVERRKRRKTSAERSQNVFITVCDAKYNNVRAFRNVASLRKKKERGKKIMK